MIGWDWNWERGDGHALCRVLSQNFSQASLALASWKSRSLRRRRCLLLRRCRLRQTQIAYLGCGDRRRGVGPAAVAVTSICLDGGGGIVSSSVG